MNRYRFEKMHGLGNDFVVFDWRAEPLALNSGQVRSIADRKTGVGCDQLIVLEPSPNAAAFMRIYNADGDEVEACGNATRCIGAMLMDEAGLSEVVVETSVGPLIAHKAGPRVVRVDMGIPALEWAQIPLAEPADTLRLDIRQEAGDRPPLEGPVAVNMGNPHMIFFVADPESYDLARLGPTLEHHPMYPERANVSLAGLTAKNEIRLRVWERGVGITRACGTGACATLVAAHRRGLTDRDAAIDLDGGRLLIEWDDQDHIQMTGPVAHAFGGEIAAELLADGPG